MNHTEKLQALLRTLFQLDLADLDFGLYRLFHLRRTEIEEFISEQLPREVDEAFAAVSAEEEQRLEEELEDIKAQIKEQISEEAFLPTGELKPEYQQSDIKMVQELSEKYEQVRKKIEETQITEGHKAEVFNHLVNFFSRYYEDGDFIPKRRYGARETYAVPYNGEEVFFHWANRDQHYVKTAERFKDYAFKLSDLSGEYRVRFTMTAASVPKDNTKGNRRYFFPRPDLAIYDANAREFVLPFEYRLPTPEEADHYGTNSKAQEVILEEALPRILEAVPDVNLRALLQQDQRTEKDIADDKPELPLLLKRLRHFCKRNTSDYFIHKDLRGFLQRELEFYIKDQVLHLMDLEADLEAKRRVIRTFKRLAEKIIDFLASIEDVQRTLFEKKKFVLETDWLIPIKHVPREFWPEILRNETQLAEWRDKWQMLEPDVDLFNPDGEVNEAFLEAHPTLPVHTKHFDREFVRRLLEALPFEDLDEATDGLLVHGENYQALNLLLERYRKQVKCIYIDPPYNTGQDEFVFKDRYQHSSWLTMMEGRLLLAHELLESAGILVCHIDEHEFHKLEILLDQVFGARSNIGPMIWDKRNPKGDARGIAAQHEYITWYIKDPDLLSYEGIRLKRVKENAQRILNKAAEIIRKHGSVTEEARAEFREWLKGQPFAGGEKAYNQIDERGEVFRLVSMAWPNKSRAPDEYFKPLIHPVTGKPCPVPERGWRYPPETMEKLLKANLIIFGPDEATQPQRKYLLRDNLYENVPSLYYFGGSDDGLQKNMGFVFANAKPTRLAQYIETITLKPGDLILDFFAGSGTTGHAVINLNREDGGWRKFILVEMGEYFDTVLLPRIAKVMYTPEWKDGKPRRAPTPEEAERTPRLVKILRIESYEDTLHNLAATAERLSDSEEAKKREEAIRGLVEEGAYWLCYWVELPLKEAEACLRVLDLAHPFAYTMEVLTDDGPVRKPVDLMETFNYLYGLRVKRYETWRNPADGDRKYRVVKATDREGKRRILVLWRDMTDYDHQGERTFLEVKISEMQANGEVWDEILINGDSPTPGVASLDPLFKRLMMQGESDVG